MNIYLGQMSSGDMERMAASFLCDKNDPTILTWREVNSYCKQCLLSKHCYRYCYIHICDKNDPTIITCREVKTLILQTLSLLSSHHYLCDKNDTTRLPEYPHQNSSIICLYHVFLRSKTVGAPAQTSCCPMVSSPTMWRTAKRLWKSHAA